MSSIFAVRSGNGSGGSPWWNRGLLIIGGACIAGGALYLLLRRSSSSKGKNASKPKCGAFIKSVNGSSSNKSSAGPSNNSATSLTPGLASSQLLKSRGNEYFKTGSYSEAVEAFSEAIQLCPESEKKHLAVCYQNRAAAQDHLGNRRQSIDDCTKALELDCRYTKAILRRAKAYFEEHEWENSLDDYMLTTAIDPSVGVTNAAVKSDIENAVGHVALEYIEHLKCLKNGSGIPIRDESVLLWRSCYVGDPVLIDLNQDSGDFDSPYSRALNAIRERRYEDVVSLAEEDLELAPSELISRKLRDCILIARFSLMKEDVAMMKKYLDIFETIWSSVDRETKEDELNKRLRAIYFLLLASLKVLTHSDSFTKDLEMALEADEGNLDAYLGSAMLLSECGQMERAIEYFDKLIAIAPQHHLVKHMKANCVLALKASTGDVAGTLVAMQKVDELLQRNQDVDPILHLITGRLYYAAQNKDLAKASFAKAAVGLPNQAAPDFYLAVMEAEDESGSPEQMRILEEKMNLCLSKEKAYPDALAVLAKIAFQRDDFERAMKLYEQCLWMCPLRTSDTAILPTVAEYVQIRSLKKAIDAIAKLC